MEFLLDMKTIFITLVMGHLFAVVIISSYWKYHKKDTILNSFLMAKSTHAAGWLLLALRGGIPDVFTISIANSLLFLGNSFEVVAILKLKGFYNKYIKRYYIFLTMGIITVFHITIILGNIERMRIAVASVATVIMIILPAYHLVTEKKGTLLSKLMGYTYVFVIIAFIGRAVIALMGNQHMGLFTPGINQSFCLLAIYFVMFLGNTGFVLMLKEKADEELLRLASYDDLTKALNRRTFIVNAEDAIDLYTKKHEPISYLIFDIDFFKEINDRFGHEVGDRVLQHLSIEILSTIGNEHLFGRYGGDEFAILLLGMNHHEAIEVAEKIRKATLELSGQDIPSYTVSIGLTTVIPSEFTKLRQLYIESDKALYAAKENGRNCVFAKYLYDETGASFSMAND